ncbi:MAG: hypothetical protein ABWZ98_10685 [Nakamurella sp.]
MEQEPTCGSGLAQAAAVPAGLAAVAAGLAQNLEVHLQALDVDDAAAMRERDVYERISQSLRGAAAKLETAAAEMAAAIDLPMALHDMAALSGADILHAFEQLVAAENRLRHLLEARQSENEQMLTEIRAESGKPEK